MKKFIFSVILIFQIILLFGQNNPDTPSFNSFGKSDISILLKNRAIASDLYIIDQPVTLSDSDLDENKVDIETKRRMPTSTLTENDTWTLGISKIANATPPINTIILKINAVPKDAGIIIDTKSIFIFDPLTGSGSGSYSDNGLQTIIASPYSGYKFAYWAYTETNDMVYDDNNAPLGNPFLFQAKFIPLDQLNLDAHFNYIVTATSSPVNGGIISGTGNFVFSSGTGTGDYPPGTVVTLTATPLTDYEFVSWTDAETGQLVSTTVDYTFPVTKPTKLIANFKLLTYTITATPTPPIGGSTSGSGIYNIGTTVPLKATPAIGYAFVNWTEAGTVVSTNPSFSITADKDRTLQANFIQQFSITATPIPAIGGSTSGSGIYNAGTTVPLIASPATGYDFISWTETGVTISNTAVYSFIATQDRTMAANFIRKTYSITASALPTGGGTITDGTTGAVASFNKTFSHGDIITLTAIPSTGYDFVCWSEAGVTVSNTAIYSFTATQDRTLVANFKRKTYTITASVIPIDGGTITGVAFNFDTSTGTGSGIYNDGDNVTLTATPAMGYDFISWTEAGITISNAAACSFIASQNRTLVANFKRKTYSITASVLPTGGGTVTDGITGAVSFFTKTFSHGDILTLSAVPSTGYDFISWSEAGITVSNTAVYSFTTTQDRTLTANFKRKTYSIAASIMPIDGGTIGGVAFNFDTPTGTGSGIYSDGDNVTLIATPATGYKFISWTESGVTVSNAAAYSFIATQNRTLVANFAKNTYIITASIIPIMGGTIEANGSPGGTTFTGIYTYGNTITLTATLATGYDFVSWTEGGTIVSNDVTYSFTATKDRTLVANLIKKQYTITATANPIDGGTIAVTGSGLGTNTFTGIYNYGDNVMITATPTTDYEFVNWTEDGSIVSSNVNLIFNALTNRVLVANFRKSIYTVTVNANPVIGGVVKGGGMFEGQTNITVTATPADGYSFENWSDGGDTKFFNPNYSFIVNSNRNLTANFKKLEQFFITTFVLPPEGGTVTGDGGYYFGKTATLVATPAKGYEFISWTEGGISVSSNAIYNFSVEKDRTLTANFQKGSYTLTAATNPTDGGTITGTGITIGNGTNNASGTYTYGDIVTVTATPESSGKYTFVSWSDNGNTVSTNNVYTFAISKNHNLIANFKTSDQYFITTFVSPPDGGSAVGGGGYYWINTWATLTTAASKGYVFINWTEEDGTPVNDVDGNPIGETYKFLVTKDRILTANFKLKAFTINATASPIEGGTITGTGNYNYGDNVKLSAMPATGYTFVNWTENGSVVNDDSGNPAVANYSFTAEKDRALVANFIRKTYQIQATTKPTEGGTIAITGTGSGSTSFAATYTHGDQVLLSAIPAPGYLFVNWTEPDGSTANDAYGNPATADYSFIAEKDRTLTANFKLKVLAINVTASPIEGGTITGIGNYNYGDNVKLSATPTTGYEFVNWTEDGTGLNVSTPEYTFTAEKDRTFTANFIKKTYLIKATTNPTEGGVIATTGTEPGSTSFAATYTHGDQVSLSAVSAPGYLFVNWTESDGSTANDAYGNPATADYSFIAEKDRTLTANFKLKVFTINATASPTEGGSITGIGNYNYGNNVKLSATPVMGYEFVNWTEDGTTLNIALSEYVFSVEKDRTLTANYIKKTYRIKAATSPTEGGTITDGIVSNAPTFNKIFTYGDNVKLSAILATGYTFVNWTENGIDLNVSSPDYTFSADKDRTLIANLKLKVFSIKTTASPAEGGSITGAGDYNYGEKVKLSALPSTGYDFISWTEDGTIISTAPNYDFIADKDRTLIANFKLKVFAIKATALPAEGGSIMGTGNYDYGGNVKLSVMPAAGYDFINWTENGTNLNITTSDYTFSADKDRTFIANLKLKVFSIKATVSPTEGGSITGTGDYNYGENVKLTATSVPCFEFVNWTEGGAIVSSDVNYTFMATANRTLVANFKTPPTLKIIISSDSACIDESVNFKAIVGKTDTDLAWDFGDGTTSTGIEVKHIYNSTGQFNVTVKALFAPLCSVSISKIITVTKSSINLNLKDLIGCSPFHLSITPSVKDKLFWNFGDDNIWYSECEKIYDNTLDSPIRRKVTVVSANNQGCNTSASFNVTINPSPKSVIDSYTIPGRPERLVLKNRSILADSCEWELADGTHLSTKDSIIEKLNTNGLYKILLKSSNRYGCTDTTSVTHQTLLTGLYVPNAFRPNSPDPKVNTFKPIGMGLKFFHMAIYDFWGNLIWQTKEQNNPELLDGWNGQSKNGTPLPVGVYIWRIKAVFLDGTEWKGDNNGKGNYRTEGNVTLLR